MRPLHHFALVPAVLLAACTPGEAVPDPAPAVCGAGELADGGACVPEECGRGPWGNVAVDADAVYVQVGASGDGGAQAPLGSIQEALDLAGARGGGRVVVGAGTYAENLSLGEAHRDVTLAGRCRALVTLDGSAGRRDQAALLVQGEARRVPLVVSDLTVTGGPLGGLAFAVARAEVRRVEVRENARAGVMVYDAEVLLDDVAVLDTRAGGDSRVGAGVEVQFGSVELRDARVSGSADEAVHVQGPRSRATLTRVRVVDNEGYGLSALAGGDIVASEVEVAGNAEADIVVNDAGSTLALADSTVRGSRPEAERTKGVSAQGGAALNLERVVIEGPSGAGVLVGGEGTTLDLVDVTVQGHMGSGATAEGAGVVVRDGATLTARGLRVLENGGVGLGVEGGEARLEDAELRDNGGRGADVIGGGLLVLTDSRVLGNVGVGLFVDASGSRAEVAGSTLSGTSTDAEGLYGQGVIVRDGATLVASGSSLSGNTHAACTVSGTGASASLTDVALDDTVPDSWGTAASLVVMGGARAELSGGTAQRGRHAALAVLDEGTELVAEGLQIADIGPERAGVGGFGVVVGSGAHARLTDVQIARTMGAGVLAQERGSHVTMLRGTIEDTARNRDVRLAAGVVAQTDARVELVETRIVRTEGPGAVAHADGEVRMTGGAVEESQFAGLVVVAPSALTLEGTVVTARGAEMAGVGVYAQGGTLLARGVDVGPHPHAAAWFDGPGAYSIEESALSGSAGTLVGGRTTHGNAVYAHGGVGPWDGDAGLRLTGNVLRGGAGPTVLLDGAGATLEGNTWEGDGTGVWQQRCEGLDPLTPQPGWTVCEGGSLLVDGTLRFPAFNLSTIELGE